MRSVLQCGKMNLLWERTIMRTIQHSLQKQKHTQKSNFEILVCNYLLYKMDTRKSNVLKHPHSLQHLVYAENSFFLFAKKLKETPRLVTSEHLCTSTQKILPMQIWSSNYPPPPQLLLQRHQAYARLSLMYKIVNELVLNHLQSIIPSILSPEIQIMILIRDPISLIWTPNNVIF